MPYNGIKYTNIRFVLNTFEMKYRYYRNTCFTMEIFAMKRECYGNTGIILAIVWNYKLFAIKTGIYIANNDTIARWKHPTRLYFMPILPIFYIRLRQ